MSGRKPLFVRVILVAIPALTIALCAAGMYQVIDIMATVHGHWVGNSLSVAIANWLNQLGASFDAWLTTTVAPIARAFGIWAFATSTAFLVWLGLSERTAEIVTVSFAIVLDLLIVVALFRVKFRLIRRAPRRAS